MYYCLLSFKIVQSIIYLPFSSPSTLTNLYLAISLAVVLYSSSTLPVLIIESDITLLSNHPEYLLCWTSVSLDSGSTFSMTSTLKRNLNSGDGIYLLFSFDTTQTPSQPIQYNVFYTAQFWTTSA